MREKKLMLSGNFTKIMPAWMTSLLRSYPPQGSLGFPSYFLCLLHVIGLLDSQNISLDNKIFKKWYFFGGHQNNFWCFSLLCWDLFFHPPFLPPFLPLAKANKECVKTIEDAKSTTIDNSQTNWWHWHREFLIQENLNVSGNVEHHLKESTFIKCYSRSINNIF